MSPLLAAIVQCFLTGRCEAGQSFRLQHAPVLKGHRTSALPGGPLPYLLLMQLRWSTAKRTDLHLEKTLQQ